MSRKALKRLLLTATITFVVLTGVLAVHLYIVTTPKAPDAGTRIMARVDFTNALTQDNANAITAWLYQQKGIDHALVNPASRIAIFTYFPVKTSADSIVSHLKTAFPFKAERIVPTEADMQAGCPVASNTAASKVLAFFKHLH